MAEAPALTPLLEQYERVKGQYPGHLVLFRVGDFYETYGEDAKRLSSELEIVLTARSPDTRGERTPMAGVPYHSVDTYVGRLLRRGYKVAICDQVEDPKQAKGLVRREVTRVVSPGTVVDERTLPGPEHNFLATVVPAGAGRAAVAAVDVTTGETFALECGAGRPEEVASALAPLGPSEILLSPDFPPAERAALVPALRHEFPRARIDDAPPPAGTLPPPLQPSEPLAAPVAEALRRLVAYVGTTQPRLVPFLEILPLAPGHRRLRLDAKTLRHLEISRAMNPDSPDGMTLLATLDETVTAAGRRTLSFWLRNPLADVGAIRERQEAVLAWVGRGADLLLLRTSLSRIPDLSRIASRIAGRRVRPPELLALAQGLAAVEEARHWIGAGPSPGRAGPILPALDPMEPLRTTIGSALVDPPPATAEAGGLFRPGFDGELDRWRASEREGLAELEALEKRESEASGIRSLRVGYNQVFGYYFEVTRPHLARVPSHFRRKQSLSGAERFTTEELDRVAERILTARERLEGGEAERWEAFLRALETHVPALHRLGRVLGEVDALATFAHLAQTRGYVRPTVDDGAELLIREGRHPLLERDLGRRFVPNDTELGPQARLLLLTGPNMAGKSTYMRQVGLIVVLAQAGGFVPAKFARIGVVSSLFTRMGFTDEIGQGKSSFMVEMGEVAEILRSADARSLVLLDEVGRGTSTFDGLALAWATVRYLHDRVRCRTIVATHYHQLTDLAGSLEAARNAHLAVREGPDGIVFLRTLVPGSTDRSYGIHVARLAGAPPELLEEAERLLPRLEREMGGPPAGKGARRGPRYTQGVLVSAPPVESPSAVEAELRSIDPDRLTPMEALEWLQRMRARLGPAEKNGPAP